jgi:hypothetical protein
MKFRTELALALLPVVHGSKANREMEKIQRGIHPLNYQRRTFASLIVRNSRHFVNTDGVDLCGPPDI